MAEQQTQRCYACGGTGVVDRTEHTIVTNPDGTTRADQRTVTARCGHCSGSGQIG
jgi:RecJ-like exonuclease